MSEHEQLKDLDENENESEQKNSRIPVKYHALVESDCLYNTHEKTITRIEADKKKDLFAQLEKLVNPDVLILITITREVEIST